MDQLLCFLICLLADLSRFSKLSSPTAPSSRRKAGKGRKLRILLVGYNGARNTGSDVRVAAIARQLQELFEEDPVSITVMTLDAASLEGYFDSSVRLLPFSSFFPFDLYRACLSHDAAILCEGSTLKSTFANALTLFLCEAAGIMSGQGKPCIAYGSEVGVMEPFLERAAKRLCRDTWFITRTEGSLAALKRLGLKGHAGTDAAWSYKGAISSEEARKHLKAQGWDGEKPLLGIAAINPFCWPVRSSLYKWIRGTVRGDQSGQYDKWYYFSDSPERRTACRAYLASIASASGTFLQENDFFPVLIGMEDLDRRAALRLQCLLPVPSALFLSGECSADIMTGILRQLSLLVTSRYHAAVLSMEGACPVIGISMDERLAGILEELDLADDFLLHTSDPELEGKLLSALEKAWRNEASIREKILSALPRYKETLARMGNFLKAYLTDPKAAEEVL